MASKYISAPWFTPADWGSKRVGPARWFLFGSVIAKILHDAGTPVWTGVHATLAEHHSRLPYKSIVCALENIDEAEALLRAAAAFAEVNRAELPLVRVVETPHEGLEIDFAPYKKDLMDGADHWLWELKRTLGLDVRHTVINAAIAGGVRQAALEKKADPVIVGRGHLQETFGRIWSHLYPIIRDSPCPVLSI